MPHTSLSDQLTASQRRAVEHRDGPLLILAGPGSGKTRVITQRIAQMVRRGVDPRSILAITFTNKAAGEMADRVEALLPGAKVWVSTFHKFCARLLRQHARGVGLDTNYSIFDTVDQRQLIKLTMRELDIDPVTYQPAKIAAQISSAKNRMQSSEMFVQHYEERIGNHDQAVVARVYPAYQRALLASNAVDFDDLLLHTVALLVENPELRSELDARFRYVLVDEYQDTNLAQYQIVTAISQEHRNLCATGDPDQSIYGWRGARIGNILRFENDFPEAEVVRLEENFRSTQHILASADSLIAHNVERKAKSLITDNPQGAPVELLNFYDERQEADVIASEINRMVAEGDESYNDFAIFYRVNALSRKIERALSEHRVPYQVAAGLAFYERAEIKDLLAYLRLVHNPKDVASFARVVNTPTRGIGKKTQSRLNRWASTEGLSLMVAAAQAERCPQLGARAVKALKAFTAMIEQFSLADAGSISDLLRMIIDQTQLTRGWADSDTEQDQQRLANVNELVTDASQYDTAVGSESSLEGFLETTSLVNEGDSLDGETGRVTLMTLHAAKGLEFPVVYVVGVEENLIPHERSLRSDDWREKEEERRLLFVGMTRAMRRLFLTQTLRRDFRGRSLATIPSEFLMETEFVLNNYADGLGGEWDSTANRPTHDEMDQSVPDHDVPPIAANMQHARSTKQSAKLSLTTAADLLNGTSDQADIPVGFAEGMTVRHPKYGLGTVTTLSGFSKNRAVTVQFHDRDRIETFIAAKCPLQPVGMG